MHKSKLQIDEEMMAKAIDLGEKGRITAPPNPWVGCLIVKNGHIVGEGFHHEAGTPHAEILALKQAGEQARDATAYISLEPCAHHGRTPPCAKALVQAGISRAVIALEDPDPRVNGQGIHILRQADIEVTLGVCADSARSSLEPYLWQRRTGRPFCLAKAACSIDGRIAAVDGSSQWISTPEARVDAHAIRAASQAILVGAGTALYDKPQLTVRDSTPPPQPPLRVIFDTSGRVPTDSPLFNTKLAPTLVLTSKACPEEIKDSWKKAGAEVEVIPTMGQSIDLHAALDILGQRGIIQVMVEGGGMLLGSLLRERLINHMCLYIGPVILGDEGLPLFKYTSIPSIKEAPKLRLINTKQFGQTVRLDYVPQEIATIESIGSTYS
jgi:diaminohydroxyphosphoribosylaminopyrimidine deaminase / 5-amino-6-(5-phosphoribosylamino)uracil reductase